MADAVLLSLQVSLLAVALSLPFAIGVALVLARTRRRWRLALDVLVHLPLVLPPVVTGYALLSLFSPRGALGGLGLAFSTPGAALACAVVAFPLMVRPIRQAFEATDHRHVMAAYTLGATPWRAFWTISLPIAAPGVFAGILLAFGRSLGEFGATIAFAGNIEGVSRTLPLALYSAMQTPGAEAEATALAWISVTLAVVTLGLSELFARRRAWWRA